MGRRDYPRIVGYASVRARTPAADEQGDVLFITTGAVGRPDVVISLRDDVDFADVGRLLHKAADWAESPDFEAALAQASQRERVAR